MEDEFETPTAEVPSESAMSTEQSGPPVGDAPTGTAPAVQPSPRRRHERAVIRTSVAAAVLVVGFIGAVIGHVAWQPKTPNALVSTGHTSTPVGSGNRNSGFGNGGGYSGSIGNGGGFQIQLPSSGNAQSGSASTAEGAPSNTKDIASGVDSALVDINTDLGYQDGEAAGTGIVLTSNGEILTNNHVIEGATTVSVVDIGNGKTYSGTVVGYDHVNDVAVVQLKNASGLTTAKLGDSSTLKVGDAVVGVGNAGGVGGTPSYAGGAVTAINQSITASDEATGSAEQLKGLIGTNANIEAGDSGGPLVNSSGEVIGMDTAGSSGSGFVFESPNTSSTQGYAIPIDKALSIVKQIVAGDSTSSIHIGPTAFLGVSVSAQQSSTSPFGNGGLGGGYGYGNGSFGNTGNSGTSTTPTSGAYIAQVVPNTPAASAGLEAGDTITSIGGQTVTTPSSLTQIILKDKPGQSVPIGYVDSSGQKHTVTVTFAKGPAQ